LGFFSGLNTEKYDRQYSDKYLIGRILMYFRPYKKQLVIISGLILAVSLANASLPILVSKSMDWLQKEYDIYNLLLLCFAILVVGVVAWLLNWMRRRLTVQTIADVVLQLSTDAFKCSAEHDLSFYDEFSSGRVLSRITSDTRDFGELVNVVTDFISQVVEALVLTIVLINISPLLTAYLYIILPFIFIFASFYRRLARVVTRRGMQAMAEVNAAIKETISGISIAKNFRQEASIYADFNEANKLSFRVNIKRAFVLSIVFPTLNVLGGFATALLLYFGGVSAAQGAITIGAWYLFILSLDRFLFPVMNLSSLWTQIQNGFSAAERVFALIDANQEVVQIDQRAVTNLSGGILFKDVCFQYRTGNDPVIENFNLAIQPGENVALVGHTGSGKSTLAKLIARFYEFQSGEILIDGKDIRSFNLLDYRKHLGIVSQVPFLFSGTVLENIRFAQPDVSEAHVIEVANKIGDGDWVSTLRDGLHTQVGERGALLSMGQRQIVSLVRVLIQRPEIFILDEATANIDPFTEWQIQQALNLIFEFSTSIMIAHRLSTIKSVDRIIVLDQGRIIEEGTHDALIAGNGHYAELYNTYFRHQSLDYIEKAREFVNG
jgi:ATP-binding cassette, subfamily B, bacterial